MLHSLDLCEVTLDLLQEFIYNLKSALSLNGLYYSAD